MSLGVDGPDGPQGDATTTADGAPDPTARLRALAHPVRLRILSLLTASAFTAAEIARELDLTHANASYHLRHLLAAEVIEVAGEERIRGGVAKRYRYDASRDFDWKQRRDAETAPGAADGETTPDHRLVYAALATELRRRAERVRRGPGNFLTDAEFWVDDDTWDEVRNTIAEASARLHAAAKAPRTPGTSRVSATVALFRMED
ncbi:helix-turn-helix domain-containing protein [Micromonospora sp. WMMD1102]|uniref:ArsR/SmtB family transcription factor n=1 Tax=Micromonospora sp. WMMD1102 TaxID=3016105 RepID=UPI0024157C21|nr:helix-turn-helix domain-containing protein [Micromonospora sp. WMMD1102]MDG4790734.1 helix-turn-helix domain-containing protein [Micromonospora sp. WMMD1102]MDG4792181.1 helix-turn-helix domain-containing protein [Micromonospora sp. WMMD1102]